MTIDFFKYQGTGNDFIVIDDREQTFPATDQAFIEWLCHRRFGIGADGLILLQNDPEYDFRMVYFNADGAEGSMCGNGGRCIVRFAHDLGLFERETRFQAADGEHTAVVDQDEISLKMSNVSGLEQHSDYAYLNTGSPHVVKFTEDLASLDVVSEGRAIRYSSTFTGSPESETPDRGLATRSGGTNVNFVQPMNGQTLFVRTYERGVEDETYSCGTGVTAAALVAHQQLQMLSPVQIKTLGGDLRVSFQAGPNDQFDQVYLIGPAKRVFAGAITV